MWTFNSLQGESVNWYLEEEYKALENKLTTLTKFIETQCAIYKANQTEDRVCDKCKDSNCLLKDIIEIIEGAWDEGN